MVLSEKVSRPLPANLGDCQNLKDLDLSKNSLVYPHICEPGIGFERLKLKKLCLSHNYLTDIPRAILNMTSLESIELINNIFQHNSMYEKCKRQLHSFCDHVSIIGSD